MSNNAVILSLKASLEELEKIKEQRAKVMEEAVQRIQNFNGIEDLMGVHQSQKSKGEVYESIKKDFKDIFMQLEVLDK